MLETICDIGGHMIRARVFEVIGDLDSAHEEWSDAEYIAHHHGYLHGRSGKDYRQPSFLETYPELKSAWEDGDDQGTSHWESWHCNTCQDPDNEMCPAHG